MTPRRRWPRAVFDEGTEPDPRFSLANERTFLAWIRTSLGLTAAGVAIDALATTLSDGTRTALAASLIVLGMVASSVALARWMFNERALRRRDPLPGFVVGLIVTTTMVIAGLVVLVEVL